MVTRTATIGNCRGPVSHAQVYAGEGNISHAGPTARHVVVQVWWRCLPGNGGGGGQQHGRPRGQRDVMLYMFGTEHNSRMGVMCLISSASPNVPRAAHGRSRGKYVRRSDLNVCCNLPTIDLHSDGSWTDTRAAAPPARRQDGAPRLVGKPRGQAQGRVRDARGQHNCKNSTFKCRWG